MSSSSSSSSSSFKSVKYQRIESDEALKSSDVLDGSALNHETGGGCFHDQCNRRFIDSNIVEEGGQTVVQPLSTSMVIVGAVVFVGDSSRGILFPVLWALCEQTGGTLVQLGYLVATFSLGRLAVTPALGYFCDKYRHRLSLIISSSILLFGAVLWANVSITHSLQPLFVAQFIMGCGSGSLGVTRSYVVEQTPRGLRTHALALLTALQYAGFTVSPVLGSVLSTLGSKLGGSYLMFALPAYSVGFLSLLCLLLLLIAFKDIPASGLRYHSGEGDVTAPKLARLYDAGQGKKCYGSESESRQMRTSNDVIVVDQTEATKYKEVAVVGSGMFNRNSSSFIGIGIGSGNSCEEGACSALFAGGYGGAGAGDTDSDDYGDTDHHYRGGPPFTSANDMYDPIVQRRYSVTSLASVNLEDHDNDNDKCSSAGDSTGTRTTRTRSRSDADGAPETANDLVSFSRSIANSLIKATESFDTIVVMFTLILMNVTTKGSIAVYETLGAQIATAEYSITSMGIGTLVSVSGAIGFFQLLVFRSTWGRYFTDVQLMIGGLAVMTVAQLSFFSFLENEQPARWRFVVFIVLMYGFGYPIASTAVLGSFSKLMKAGPQAALLGWFATAGSASRVLLPVLSGYLEKNNPGNPGSLVLILLTSSLLGVVLLRRRIAYCIGDAASPRGRKSPLNRWDFVAVVLSMLLLAIGIASLVSPVGLKTFLRSHTAS